MKRLSSNRRLARLGILLSIVTLFSVVGVASASAKTGAWWRVDSGPSPTSLQPGTEGRIWATAVDLGWRAILASEAHPVVVTDTLPAGLEASASTAKLYLTSSGGDRNGSSPVPCEVSGQTVTCTRSEGMIFASQGIEVVIAAHVSSTLAGSSSVSNTVRVSGGLTGKEEDLPAGTPEAEPAAQEVGANEQTRSLQLSSTPTTFGSERYELQAENDEGGEETQAGAHPFQLTTTLNLRDTQTLDLVHPGQALETESTPEPVRNLDFTLPVGLLGDVNSLQQCTAVQFNTIYSGDSNGCPASTAIGVANIKLYEPDVFGTKVETVPVFNLVPAPGEPARFGIEFAKVTVPLTTKVKSGSSYAVEVSAEDTSEAAAVIDTQVTFWGAPSDPRHNASRGWECLANARYQYALEKAHPCPETVGDPQAAFLTLPTLCTHPQTSVLATSWPYGPAHLEEVSEELSYTFPSALIGCEALSEAFAPAIDVEPESHDASTPTGLTVGISIPQQGTETVGQLAEADVAENTLTLPVGFEASPGAANGLQACGAPEVGLLPGLPEVSQLENDKFTAEEPTCPTASKIGTTEIETPLLTHPLEGGVYLAEQDTNLVEEKLVLYIVAKDPVSGVLVKLAGEVHVNQTTGQLVSVFHNTPPLPFSKFTVTLFGGPRASQSTPPFCGTYDSSSSFAPSSGGAAKSASWPFKITSGVRGGPCPGATRGLTPGFTAGSSNTQAGAFTNFTLSVAHPDEDQPLSGISTTLPLGAAALLSTITPCPEPAAGAPWVCGPESLMGRASTSSGLGGEPFTLAGNVYLTTGYDGAPFGLLVSTEAKAGPFNLGMVYVRSRIDVNPETAAVTVTSDPGPHGDLFPTRLKGVPVALKQLTVEVNRPGFEFNGTNCDALATTGTLFGSEGAAAPVSSPFQVKGCAALPFAPRLTAVSGGKGSRSEGTYLDVKIESGGVGQADIRKVDLTIPKELPSRLETLHKACLAATFEASPTDCSEESIVGRATVHTPVLSSPLKGPAYLVSHGSAAFPDVEFVLHGEGITLVLDGKTEIAHGYTYSRFETAPDAPFTSFETEFPAGRHSIFGSYASAKNPEDLCAAKLEMPTEITAQDGALIRTTTKIAPSGCKKAASHQTRAQKLKKALAACRKRYRRKHKRQACERVAQARYGTSHAKKSTSKTK